MQVQPDLLNQLSRLFEVAVIGDADRDLVDDPVAALVLNGAQQAEWHGVDRAAVVPQPDRTDAEAFDRAFVIAALDVLADPKRILQQEEDARDDVTHQGLRAKADGDPEDTEPGEQRPDIEPQSLQCGDGPGHDDNDQDRMAQQRQQMSQAARPNPARPGPLHPD